MEVFSPRNCIMDWILEGVFLASGWTLNTGWDAFGTLGWSGWRFLRIRVHCGINQLRGYSHVDYVVLA